MPGSIYLFEVQKHIYWRQLKKVCDLIRSLPSKATVVRMACVDSSPSLHQVVSSMNGKRHGADHDDPKRRYAGLAGGYVRSSVQFSYNQHR